MALADIFGASGALMGLLITLFALASLGVTIWAIADAASRPSGAFTAAGSNKVMWIVIIAVGWLVTGVVGLILACVYLASIRPRVKAITR
jgi:hypothetical protein